MRIAPHLAALLTPALLSACCCADDNPSSAAPAPNKSQDGWTDLFNGRDLTGWKPRDYPAPPGKPAPKHPNGWSVKDGVLASKPPGTDLDTVGDYYSFELHAEFRIPKGSNSGLYLRGKYEVQIFDSYGKPPDISGCGALYKRVAPSVNAAKPAGEWQTYDITFRGRALKVVHNGTTVQDLPDVGDHGTGAQSAVPDGPGPIRIQGDHGGIELRNLRIKPLKD